jgi:hypothetical protein
MPASIPIKSELGILQINYDDEKPHYWYESTSKELEFLLESFVVFIKHEITG